VLVERDDRESGKGTESVSERRLPRSTPPGTTTLFTFAVSMIT